MELSSPGSLMKKDKGTRGPTAQGLPPGPQQRQRRSLRHHWDDGIWTLEHPDHRPHLPYPFLEIRGAATGATWEADPVSGQ